MKRAMVMAALAAGVLIVWFSQDAFPRGREYDPKTGRFMQRDPIGYVDGMNRYEYERSNPVINRDPSGLKVIWLSVNPTGKAEAEGAWDDDPRGALKDYNRRVQQVLDKLRQVTPELFKEAQRRTPCGVTLNGKPYTEKEGSLEDFRKTVGGELHSVHKVQTAGGYKAAVTQFKALAPLANQPFDDLGFDSHGTHITTVTRDEEGNVVSSVTVPGFVFNDQPVEGDTVRKEIVEIAATGKGRFVGPVACFQEKGQEETIGYTKESYLDPNPDHIDLTPLSGTRNGEVVTQPRCTIEFQTLKLEHKKGGVVVPH